MDSPFPDFSALYRADVYKRQALNGVTSAAMENIMNHAETDKAVRAIVVTGTGDTIRDTAYIKQAERRNQRSVALNYFSEEGREIFLNMIRDADIFMAVSYTHLDVYKRQAMSRAG